MRALCKTWLKLFGDQTGQTTVEWTLLLVVFGLPMFYVFRMLLSILVEHYRMITFMVTLPF